MIYLLRLEWMVSVQVEAVSEEDARKQLDEATQEQLMSHGGRRTVTLEGEWPK